MNVPKIILNYSHVYDAQWKKIWDLRVKTGEITPSENYPSKEQLLKYLNELEYLWNKRSQEILEKIATITTLPWKNNEVPCYIIGRGQTFSNPLTIAGYTKHVEYATDLLTHEMIHQIFIQNMDKMKKFWQFVYGAYKEEENTKIHIHLTAIHKKIYLELFDEKRLQRDIRHSGPDYKRAWEIVEEEGYENLIKELVSHLS